MKNARTPLLRSLRKAILISHQSDQTRIHADEPEELHTFKTFFRRDFISTSLKSGELLSITNSFPVLSSRAGLS